MSFKPVQKLDVSRSLSTGEIVPVGTLAQNRTGCFFQYNQDYLEKFGNLSPFTLNATAELQLAAKEPHSGLHGAFADSLPDGWGLLLQDRVFRQHGILPNQVTAMDRLAFVGDRGIGALSFSPVFEHQPDAQTDLHSLGLQAQAVFDGQTEEVLHALVAAGSSGGARPKAQVFCPPSAHLQQCRTTPLAGDEAWLVKFTSSSLPLGHQEGLCEAAYLRMAEHAELHTPHWTLLPASPQSGAAAWLGLQRFDWLSSPKVSGRKHMHSACGLLDADFRLPSLDYEDLIKASRQLCKSPAVGQLQFKRAIFNLFSANQDDHSKNWSFLQNDDGSWEPAPFYDVTFSPHPLSEHATPFAGYGKVPPLKAVQKLAATAGFSSWQKAQHAIAEIADAVSHFSHYAKEMDVTANTIEEIQRNHNQRHSENKRLLTSK